MREASSSAAIGEKVCGVHGHNLASIGPDGKLVCTKCGLTHDEIRHGKMPEAAAAATA